MISVAFFSALALALAVYAILYGRAFIRICTAPRYADKRAAMGSRLSTFKFFGAIYLCLLTLFTVGFTGLALSAMLTVLRGGL